MRNRTGEQLKRRVAELEYSNEELRQLFRLSSRDLQEPLDEVLRYLRFVEARYKDRLDSDANEFIASAVEGAIRIQKIVHDMAACSDKDTYRTSQGNPDASLLGKNGVLE